MGHEDNNMDTVTAYFSALNPLARKIHHDIARTQTDYEHVWHALNRHEQIDLINECLIKPEITLRYFNSVSSSLSATSTTYSAISNEHNDRDEVEQSGTAAAADTVAAATNRVYAYDGRNLRTFQMQRSGQKMVHDETIGIFRDEHSGPFSFKTKSQLNLSLFPGQSGGGGGVSILPELISETKAIIGQKMYSKNPTTDTGGGGTSSTKESGEAITTRMTFDSKTDFLRSFICTDHLGLNANATAAAAAAASTSAAISSTLDSGLDSERCGLIDSIDIGSVAGSDVGILPLAHQPNSSSTSLQSDDDYEKAAYGEESTLLLNSSAYEMRKGFEFLSNW